MYQRSGPAHGLWQRLYMPVQTRHFPGLARLPTVHVHIADRCEQADARPSGWLQPLARTYVAIASVRHHSYTDHCCLNFRSIFHSMRQRQDPSQQYRSRPRYPRELGWPRWHFRATWSNGHCCRTWYRTGGVGNFALVEYVDTKIGPITTYYRSCRVMYLAGEGGR